MALKTYRWQLSGSNTVFDDLVLTDCIITIHSLTFDSTKETTRLELRFSGETTHIRSFNVNINNIDNITEDNVINAVAEYYPLATQIL
jgi:hypothetical protein